MLSPFDQYEQTQVTTNVNKVGRFWIKMLRSFDHGLSIRLSRNERDFKGKSFLFVLRSHYVRFSFAFRLILVLDTTHFIVKTRPVGRPEPTGQKAIFSCQSTQSP